MARVNLVFILLVISRCVALRASRRLMRIPNCAHCQLWSIVLFRVRLFIYDGNNLLEVEANPNSALLGILCCLEVAYQLIISTTGRQDVKFVTGWHCYRHSKVDNICVGCDLLQLVCTFFGKLGKLAEWRKMNTIFILLNKSSNRQSPD